MPCWSSLRGLFWIPAFAGMTRCVSPATGSSSRRAGRRVSGKPFSPASLAAFLYLVLSATQSPAQQRGAGSLEMRVLDEESEEPLAGAHVTFPDLFLYWITDADGVARVSGIPPGEHQVEISLPGYMSEFATIGFEQGTTGEGEARLARQPIELPGVTVTADRVRINVQLMRNGFYDRARMGIGTHLDRAAIERRHPFFTSDIFRGLAGVRYWIDRHGETWISMTRCGGMTPNAWSQAQRNGQSFLGPDVYVDGVLWTGRIDDLDLEWIEAVEVYTSAAQVPIQYTRGSDTCGVVVIWTRR